MVDEPLWGTRSGDDSVVPLDLIVANSQEDGNISPEIIALRE